MFDSLIQAFSGPGAGFMYAITALLAFGIAVALERTYVFWVRWRIDEERLFAQVSAGDLDAAAAATESHPVGRLITAGKSTSTSAAAWDAMGGEAALIQSAVRQRVPYLATVGNISTMLGLLGTVYGLILAFTGLGDASAVERASNLSSGIATAMATTAWGLLVGIPALGVHAIIEGRSQHLLAVCESVASRVAASRKG